MAEKYGRDGIGGRGYLECSQPCCKKQGTGRTKGVKVCFNRKCAGICFDFTSYLEALSFKTVDEIYAYADVFWQKHQKIENGHKYIERIEKGEADIEKKRIVDLSIKLKFDQLMKAFKDNNPNLDAFSLADVALIDDLGERDLSSFSPDEDKVCALGLFKYGYGYWNLIRNDLRNSIELQFNWLAKSRTAIDVQKRCDQLI
jgi:SWI/SNF-related matrix-associated actin-dependent regulator of chromatin subfamily A member 5